MCFNWRYVNVRVEIASNEIFFYLWYSATRLRVDIRRNPRTYMYTEIKNLAVIAKF